MAMVSSFSSSTGAGAAGAAGATGAAGGGAAGAAAGAAAAGAAGPLPRCFRYSSNEGASPMDLRGSSCWKAAGSRVSNMPPAPLAGPLKRAVPLVRGAKAGEKAAAEPKRATEARASFMVLGVKVE